MNKNIVRNAMKNFCICLASFTLLIGFTQAQERHVFSAAERKADELQIQKDIASYLEWALFGLENTDLGEMNQSISFNEMEKKRFGIFEAFNEKNQKIFEIRLHQKGQLIGRYLPRPHACTNGSLLVLDRKRSYSTFEFYCSEPGTGKPNTRAAFYLYHHDSNNFYEIYDAEVGDKFYGYPSVNFSNDIYQFKWTHSLREKAETKTVVRNFKIVKMNNQWVVQSSPIANKDDYVISILPMLLLDPKYNLPKVFDLGEAVAEAEETEHCMPRQQMAINGATIFTKESEVLKKLGEPEKKTNGWGMAQLIIVRPHTLMLGRA